MVFGWKHHLDINIKFNNESIERVTETNFLDITVDEIINWHSHINHVKSKIYKSTAIICNVKHLFDSNILKTLYYSLIVPYLTYCV